MDTNTLWLYTLEYICFNHIDIYLHPFLVYKDGQLKGRKFKCCGRSVGSNKLKFPSIIYFDKNNSTEAWIVSDDKIVRFNPVISDEEMKKILKIVGAHVPEKRMVMVIVIEIANTVMGNNVNEKLYLSVIGYLSGMDLRNAMKIQSMLCYAQEIHLKTCSSIEPKETRIQRLITEGIIENI